MAPIKKPNLFLNKFTVLSDKSKTICKVPGCEKEFKGFIIGNLKRHFYVVHKDLEESLNDEDLPVAGPSKKKIKISMDKSTLCRATIKMVTKDSIPFRILDSEGFREIVDPIYKELGVTINRHNIKDKVSNVAQQIIDMISNELKNKIFSLKIDSATRHGRSILGVNAQFANNKGEIQVRTLGMVELKKRHSSEYLKEEVTQILKKYDCTLSQIFCCTVDNGANMVKCIKLLESDQEIDVQSQKGNDERDELNIDFIENSLETTLRCVRCASHTLQVILIKNILFVLL